VLEADAVEADVEADATEADVEAVEADAAQTSRVPEPGAPGSALAALQSGLPSGLSSELSVERSEESFSEPPSEISSEGAASDLALAPRAVTEENPDSSVVRPRNSRNQRDRTPEPSARQAPPVNNNRLAVPSSSIPIGDEGAFFSPPGTVSSSGLPAPTSRAQSLGLFYRVFVEASNSDMQDEVRSVVPDAFRTFFDGQTVMQVGAFPTEDEAQDRKRMLEDNDLSARVEYIE
jgi:hypothetical protein